MNLYKSNKKTFPYLLIALSSIMVGCTESEKKVCKEGELTEDGYCVYTPENSNLPLTSCPEGMSFNGKTCVTEPDG